MCLKLREGAFIVGDAHCSHIRPQFLEFLKKIKSEELKPTQLILLGDIFDTLFGEVFYTHKINQEAIDIINEISQKIEVIYLEGNHDFNLQPLFKNVKVFNIKNQPIEMKFNAKKVLLSHGDKPNRVNYNIYTAIIRNRFVLKTLAFLDEWLNHKILQKLDEYLSKKEDCREFVGFENVIKKRVANAKCDYYIEGHFHQNRSFMVGNFLYINIAAFACNQRYFVVELSNSLLKEKFL